MPSNASGAALPSEESVSSHHPERGPIRGAEKDGRQRGRGGEERRAQVQGRIIDTEAPVACRGVFPFFFYSFFGERANNKRHTPQPTSVQFTHTQFKSKQLFLAEICTECSSSRLMSNKQVCSVFVSHIQA